MENGITFFTQNWIFSDIVSPVLDILLLAFLLYQSYLILIKTRAVQLVKGAFFIVLIYLLAFFLNLRTLLWLLNMLAPGVVIGVAIVFQPELRKIFTRIGQGEWFSFSSQTNTYHVDSLINTLDILSSQRRGCLIVLTRNVGLKNIIDTGTKLNAELSSSLLLTIFAHDTALHDGAAVIQNAKIAAAGCFLPLSEQADIRRSFGTRHRAALGLAEESDAVILIVSEETGAISLAYDANLYYNLTLEEIRIQLAELMNYPSGYEMDEVEEELE